MLNIDKMTYSIGQAAEFADVAQSTLRYWETVIHALKPQKTEGGTRRYRRSDVELIALIKELLHVKGYTIKGANLYIKNKLADNSEPEPIVDLEELPLERPRNKENKSKVNTEDLDYIYEELLTIKKILE